MMVHYWAEEIMLLLRKVRMMLRCVGGALFTLLLLRQRHTCAPQSSDNLRKFQSFVVWGTFTTTCPSQHGDNFREFQSYQFEPTCSSSRLKLIVRTKKNVLFWRQPPLSLYTRCLNLNTYAFLVALCSLTNLWHPLSHLHSSWEMGI